MVSFLRVEKNVNILPKLHQIIWCKFRENNTIKIIVKNKEIKLTIKNSISTNTGNVFVVYRSRG